MTAWKKNLILVWLSQFLGLSGFFFVMPFIPYYIEELGTGNIAERNAWIATFTVAGYSSVAIFSPIWGTVADRFGRKSMLLRANFCNALIITAMGFVPNLYMLVGLRFLMGVFSGSTTAAQTLVSSETPHERRGFALGMLSSAIYTGTMAGCFLGGVIVDLFGYKTAFFVCGLLYFVSGMLIILGVNENFSRPRKEKIKPVGKRKTFWGFDIRPVKIVWLILLLLVMMGLARQFDAAFFPLLVQKIHGSVEGAAIWTGLISGIVALGGMLAGPILGWCADKITAPKVAMISTVLAGLFMIPQGLAHCMLTLTAGRFMMIFFAGGLDPVFQIWLAKSTPKKIQGVVFGWSLTAKCIGWMLAAVLSGSVATLLGLRWIYALGCLIFLLLLPLISYSSRKLSRRRAGTM